MRNEREVKQFQLIVSFFHTPNPVYTSRLHVSMGHYTLWQRLQKIKGVGGGREAERGRWAFFIHIYFTNFLSVDN